MLLPHPIGTFRRSELRGRRALCAHYLGLSSPSTSFRPRRALARRRLRRPCAVAVAKHVNHHDKRTSRHCRNDRRRDHNRHGVIVRLFADNSSYPSPAGRRRRHARHAQEAIMDGLREVRAHGRLTPTSPSPPVSPAGPLPSLPPPGVCSAARHRPGLSTDTGPQDVRQRTHSGAGRLLRIRPCRCTRWVLHLHIARSFRHCS